jgi:hypothetical protein
MHKIIEVKPLPNYRLWLKFSDGVEGEVKLSDLVGKGVFSAWKDPEFFKSVYIDQISHTVTWKGELDLDPDNLYAQILGVTPISTFKKEPMIP